MICDICCGEGEVKTKDSTGLYTLTEPCECKEKEE